MFSKVINTPRNSYIHCYTANLFINIHNGLCKPNTKILFIHNDCVYMRLNELTLFVGSK